MGACVLGSARNLICMKSNIARFLARGARHRRELSGGTKFNFPMLLSFATGTPSTHTQASSGLSESCHKAATYRSLRFLQLTALVPSAATFQSNLTFDRNPSGYPVALAPKHVDVLLQRYVGSGSTRERELMLSFGGSHARHGSRRVRARPSAGDLPNWER